MTLKLLERMFTPSSLIQDQSNLDYLQSQNLYLINLKNDLLKEHEYLKLEAISQSETQQLYFGNSN